MEVVSRGQTAISAQGLIASSISARAEKGLVYFLYPFCLSTPSTLWGVNRFTWLP